MRELTALAIGVELRLRVIKVATALGVKPLQLVLVVNPMGTQRKGIGEEGGAENVNG
jgi:hypothetical protein